MGKSRQRYRSTSTSSTDGDVKNRRQKHHGNNQNNNHGAKQRNGPNKNNSFQEKWTREELAPIFPSFTPFVVFVVTLALRVDYVTRRENWWMVHPDEVYQSMEIAHIKTFGYGFQTYDFSPPESLDDVTMYRQMQLKADMYGLRSPLFPYYYVIVSHLVSVLGYSLNPYLLWRVAHVFITSFLPLAVYRYAFKLFRSSDTASVAAILVASSVHLNVFGTHCFLHSFLAPFTFLALALLGDFFRGGCEANENCVTGSTTDGHNETHSPSTTSMPSNSKTSSWKNGYVNGTTEDMTNNNNVSEDILRNGCNSHSGQRNASSGQGGNVHFMGNKDLMNGRMRNGANGNSFDQSKARTPTTSMAIFSAFMAGFLLVLTSYIRPDVILVYCANMILFLTMKFKFSFTKCVTFFVGMACAVLIGLASDFYFYGQGVISPINWVRFNAIKNMSAIIFGKMSSFMYVSEFFCHDSGILLLSISCVVVCIVLFFKLGCFVLNSEQNEEAAGMAFWHNEEYCYEDKENASLCFKMLLMWTLLLGVYSVNEHKEMRFIHDVIILLFVFIASAVVGLRSLVKSATFSNNVIRLVVAVFVLSQWQAFPHFKNNLTWVYQKTKNVQDVNACIEFIASQNDVTGVFYDSNLHMTGAMSLLHRDVTIMSLMVGGFYEFGPQSRKKQSQNDRSSSSNSKATLQSNKVSDQVPSLLKLIDTSVNEFTSASNYIAVANAPAAARSIIEKPIYNYVVLKRDRKFLEVGFQVVFTFGRSHVLKRSLDKESENNMRAMLDRIPLSNNATVMLHEGDVLFHMSQYEEASTRFETAIQLNEKTIEAYMPLQICYRKMNNTKAARRVIAKCHTLFGEKECATVRRITPL